MDGSPGPPNWDIGGVTYLLNTLIPIILIITIIKFLIDRIFKNKQETFKSSVEIVEDRMPDGVKEVEDMW